MTSISEETVQRMVELVRRMADRPDSFFVYSDEVTMLNNLTKEAKSIVAELPKPVDPYVLAVREILGAWLYGQNRDDILTGYCDSSVAFQAALAAFKRVKGGGA